MVAALMLYRIIGIGDFGAFRRDDYVSGTVCLNHNVVQISHIIAENDPYLFRSLLSVGR